jgi:hypothetical protein
MAGRSRAGRRIVERGGAGVVDVIVLWKAQTSTHTSTRQRLPLRSRRRRRPWVNTRPRWSATACTPGPGHHCCLRSVDGVTGACNDGVPGPHRIGSARTRKAALPRSWQRSTPRGGKSTRQPKSRRLHRAAQDPVRHLLSTMLGTGSTCRRTWALQRCRKSATGGWHAPRFCAAKPGCPRPTIRTAGGKEG